MRNVQRGERRDQTQGEITMKGEEFQLIRIRTRRRRDEECAERRKERSDSGRDHD